MKVDVERLEAFLAVLPDGTPGAFEFRHESWTDPEVQGLLEGRGMALVCADDEDHEDDAPLVETAPWGYVRLRRPDYTDEDLERWAARLRSTGWDRTFVFFKHEDEGAGPRLAARFREAFQARESG